MMFGKNSSAKEDDIVQHLTFFQLTLEKLHKLHNKKLSLLRNMEDGCPEENLLIWWEHVSLIKSCKTIDNFMGGSRGAQGSRSLP